jgi:hypothetical protein
MGIYRVILQVGVVFRRGIEAAENHFRNWASERIFTGISEASGSPRPVRAGIGLGITRIGSRCGVQPVR